MKIDLSQSAVSGAEIAKNKELLLKSKKHLESGDDDFGGWVALPFNYDRAEIARIVETAAKIRRQCDAFIVIGIGGSYLGARAAVEMLSPGSEGGKQGPKIYFAGCNLSGTYHAELIEEIENKEICLCVISKSGTTTEPNIAFSVLKDLMYKKYGREEAVDRICAVTDSAKGVLREESLREGYTSFVVPDDIGGRYSVLTPVGLLPIAVAGIDIFEMLDGAQQKVELSGQPEDWKEDAGLGTPELFAAVRNELYSRGKVIEVYEYYEPKLQFFAEWLKQLFGESEGKDGKGIFPAALQFTADLHSMGQYLQEGNQIFFETVLHVEEPEKDIIVPDGAGELLAGRSMNEVNRAAMKGVTAAHLAVGIPVIRLDIPSLSPFVFGQMVYFFETACALSGYLLGVYPFNQPGVESYKAEMRKVLKEGSAREAENGQNGK